jgi:hypothetical protein
MVVVPAAVLVEVMAALPRLPAWLAWSLRLVVAGLAGRVLLHDTVYLAELTGPGSREWTPAQTWLALAGMAGLLAGVWALLDVLARRGVGRSLHLALALTCAGAAVTVMQSGYFTGGQLGVVLAATLLGAWLASLALPSTAILPPGVGVVALFGLLVMGRFFGSLSTAHALVLFVAPLLCWLAEAPRLREVRPWLRGAVGVLVVGVAVALVGARAQRPQEARPGAATPAHNPVDDYLNWKP